MPETQDTQLIREATDIFLRLRDTPNDRGLQRERDQFLARGAGERAAYDRMLQVWNVTGVARPSTPSALSRIASIAVAGIIVATGYWAYDPVRIAMMADTATGYETASVQLLSGDRIALDATSAFANHTDGHARRIELLQGAAFFDVEKETRPFIVTAGDMRVEVTGTAFEVVSSDEGAAVSVTEGSVNVVINERLWQLVPGDELIWSDATGAALKKADITTTASWRQDQLISEAMTLRQILEVIDRRLPGEIVVSNEALAQTPIVGSFDLSKPEEALTLLTELTGSQSIRLPYVVSVIMPKAGFGE